MISVKITFDKETEQNHSRHQMYDIVSTYRDRFQVIRETFKVNKVQFEIEKDILRVYNLAPTGQDSPDTKGDLIYRIAFDEFRFIDK
jgi:hypothetical protein